MADKNDWEKIEAAPTWDFQNDKEIEGVYVREEEEVGPNNSRLYTIEKQNGEMIGVWGNSVLDSRFKNVVIGEEVRIEYLGKAESQKTKGRTYHNFEVYHRKLPMTQVQDEGVDIAEVDKALGGNVK